ncbi:MAG TPA: DUF805 domain-containing protein [Rhodanobacteraceae bacterium]|jgi:uncharacterized membrane protein YhaH (DUF805 family)|nr:DUF805 domain-containing protein [Rhodanobacteraceae bacterium]
MHWYLQVLKKYRQFEGRARRSEYWYFTLFHIFILLALMLVDVVFRKMIGLHFNPFSTLYGLAVMVPNIAVNVRRLHDTDRSGWWLLLALVPLVGLVLIVFLVEDSMTSTNRYGQNPKLEIA